MFSLAMLEEQLEMYSVYYGLFFFSVVFCLLLEKTKIFESQKKVIYCVVVYLLLWLVSAMRYETVGADTRTYLVRFNYVMQDNIDGYFLKGFEVGYIILNKFIQCVYSDEQALLIVTSMMTILGMGYFFYKESKNIYITTISFISMGFYLKTMTNIRQWLAIVFVCFAFHYIWNNNKLKALMCSLLAMLMHFTAVIFIPFMLMHPLKKYKVICVYVVAVALVFIFHSVGLSFFDGIMLENYQTYIGGRFDVSKGYGAALLKIALVWMVAIIQLYVVRKNSGRFDDISINKSYWIMFLSSLTFVPVLLGYEVDILGRFINYFFVFYCLSIAEVYYLIAWKYKTMIFLIYCVAFVLYTMQDLSIADPSTTIYHSIFW